MIHMKCQALFTLKIKNKQLRNDNFEYTFFSES